MSTASVRFLIIGDGAAGMSAAGQLRRLAPESTIQIVADDPHPAYYRAALTNYLIGELRAEQLYAVTPTFYRRNRIDRVLGHVVSIDVSRRSVMTSAGAAHHYDQLLIATGSRPRTLPFEGSKLSGVRGLRTLADAQRMLDAIREGVTRQAVVVGGGPLALEWAQGLREHKVDVTMLLRKRELMPGRLDKRGSDLVLQRLERGGVRVLQDEVAVAESDSAGRVKGVRCKSGEVIPCQLVGLAVGVAPSCTFLANSGIAASERGVTVDTRMETSVTGVYAAGDVAVVAGESLGLWAPAGLQGKVAASNMAGEEAHYKVGRHYFATRLFDLDFAYSDDGASACGSDDAVSRDGERGQIEHQRVLLSDGRIQSFALLGERTLGTRARGRLLHRLMMARVDVRAVRSKLLEPGFDLLAFTNKVVPRPSVPGTGASETARAALARRAGSTRRAPSAPPEIIRDADDFALTTAGLPPAVARMDDSALAMTIAVAPEVSRPRLDVMVDGKPQAFEGRSIVLGVSEHGLVYGDVVTAPRAELLRDGDDWYVRDLGSVEGTFVNGVQVVVPVKLAAGDAIKVGDHTLRLSREPEKVERKPAKKKPVMFLQWTADEAGTPKRMAVKTLVRMGRDPARSDVVLAHAGVSAVHAECAPNGKGELFLKDLGSRHGTFVGSERLGADARLVKAGDVIVLGDARITVIVEGLE